MGVRLYALMFAIATSTLYGQNSRPITRVEACRQFSKAIVQVDTDYMHGSGFVVDPDGWIVTALHVVADRGTLKKYGGSRSLSMEFLIVFQLKWSLQSTSLHALETSLF